MLLNLLAINTIFTLLVSPNFTMYPKRLLAVFCCICFVCVLALVGAQRTDQKLNFHTANELGVLKKLLSGPIGPGDYFSTHAYCKSCHGKDSLLVANIAPNGEDINVVDDWQASMMALSAKDPFWRAKVSHEILVNPGHTLELQDNCTSCHAPMGNYTSKYKGSAAHYTIAALQADSLGLDGVSCVGCHAIADSARLGSVFSGILPYDTTRNIYGPYTFPMAGPMLVNSGFTPKYSAHLNLSKACSPCHTLINKTVDLNGNYTGATFVEQATYQEWINSNYSASGMTCQKCHMPEITGGVIIANDNPSIPYRSPFSQHIFAGGNNFMLQLMKQNKVQLGIGAADRMFDSTLLATNRLLQKNTLDIQLITDSLTSDTAYFKVQLLNKAGHKFPSGYPSRRAVVEFTVMDPSNDTLFASGRFNPDYTVHGENAAFETHHEVISQSQHSQIYELVMGDVNQQPTTVAERAAFLLKDNRLPPQGFTSNHLSYDTAKISQDAIADENFNKINQVEGSGSDIIYYRVPISGISGNIKVFAKIWYQSVPPKWLNEMFAFTSAEIDSFKQLYQASTKIPVLIAADSILQISLRNSTDLKNEASIKVWPSISNGSVFVQLNAADELKEIYVYSSNGKLEKIMNIDTPTKYLQIVLPSSSGVYFLNIRTRKMSLVKKVYRE